MRGDFAFSPAIGTLGCTLESPERLLRLLTPKPCPKLVKSASLGWRVAAVISWGAQALSVQTSWELEYKVEAAVLREAWRTVWEQTPGGDPQRLLCWGPG